MVVLSNSLWVLHDLNARPGPEVARDVIARDEMQSDVQDFNGLFRGRESSEYLRFSTIHELTREVALRRFR